MNKNLKLKNIIAVSVISGVYWFTSCTLFKTIKPSILNIVNSFTSTNYKNISTIMLFLTDNIYWLSCSLAYGCILYVLIKKFQKNE